MHIRNTILLFIGLAITSSAMADVQVTMQENQDGKSVVKLNRDWARIANQAMPDNYMLIDMNKQVSYMIDTEQKIVMKLEDMGDMIPPMMQNPGGMKKPDISISEAGGGPTVAGFKTMRYLLKIENQLCSEHFLSKEPLSIPEIKRFAKVMEKQADMNMGMGMPGSPCELAEIEFDKQAFKFGIPLMSKNSAGNETFIITEIKDGVRFSTQEFDLPKGYQVVSQQELMQREMNRAMENMPSDEQTGEMDSQMQVQLKKLQDMFNTPAEN